MLTKNNKSFRSNCVLQLVFILIFLMSQPVSAHSSASTSETGVNFLFAMGTIAGVSAIIGLITVAFRNHIKLPVKWSHNHKLVGILFIVIGLTATSSVIITQFILGIIGGALGLSLGTLLFTRRSHNACSKAAISSIIVHRFIEGSALAALSTTGRLISVLGIVILTVHATIECISLGAYQKISRIQAIGSVLIVTFSFILGFGTGLLGFTATETVVAELSIAAVGGLLFILGISELQLKIFRRARYQSTLDIKNN